MAGALPGENPGVVTCDNLGETATGGLDKSCVQSRTHGNESRNAFGAYGLQIGAGSVVIRCLWFQRIQHSPFLLMSLTTPYSAIESTLRVLLSPLDYPSVSEWQRSAHREMVALTNADALCIHAPVHGAESAWYTPHMSAREVAQYEAYSAENPEWEILEHRFVKHIAATGQDASHESEFLDRRTRMQSSFHRDFLAPNKLNDLTVATARFAPARSARLHFSNRTWRGPEQFTERVQLVRTILPAYTHGLSTWHRHGQQRADLGYLFDTLNDAVLLFDADGTLVHVNRSAHGLLHTREFLTDTEAQQVQHEARLVAQRINALMKHAFVGGPTIAPSMANRDVPTARGLYSIRGALAPSWMFGKTHAVLVTVAPQAPRELSDSDIRAQFGLTAREVEVAKHVAAGLSNHDVAARMGVSFFTARNHVERVLNKLGANNRAQVGARIRGGTSGVIAA